MNWNAQGLSSVNKERIWKEYVAKESDKRVVYDEFRQRVTDKTREPEVKISPRGKRFMTKEPYGIKMEINNATGRYTPVLTDKVLAGPVQATVSMPRSHTSPTKSTSDYHESTSSEQSPLNSRKNHNHHKKSYESSHPTYRKDADSASSSAVPPIFTSPSGTVKLPAIPLSPSVLSKQHQSDQEDSPLTSQHLKSPNTNSRFNNSPRKNQSALQQQYMQNNFSNSHGGAEDPLDRALKNLQFMSTTNGTIGRGTVEMLHSSPVSPLRSGNSTTNSNPNIAGETHPQQSDFGNTLSGSLRATYLQSTSPLKGRSDAIPGSPRSYVVKDESGGGLFDYSRKQCDITKTHHELSLRK